MSLPSTEDLFPVPGSRILLYRLGACAEPQTHTTDLFRHYRLKISPPKLLRRAQKR